jgi:two-component system, cell cycle response regulator DivK
MPAKSTDLSTPVSWTGEPPLVLVVDDYADSRDVYAEYLKYAGFRVAEAANGQEALDKVGELLPDVVIMDLSLPIMDGWEATRRLRRDPETRGIPIIALTGHVLAGHSNRAKEAGCDAYLAKPCLPEELLEEVKSMLSVGKRYRA